MLGAPKDWDKDKGEIVPLPVTVDDYGVMHSFWRPTEVDIASILAGLPIRLSVVGVSHPPVAITVTNKV